MRALEFIWYPDLLKIKTVLKYNDFKNLPSIKQFKFRIYKMRTETEYAMAHKPEFDRLRAIDYSKALEYWDEHFPAQAGSYHFPPDESENLSPQEIIKKYPQYGVSNLPKKDSTGNYDPSENVIYIHWWIKNYLKLFPYLISENTILGIEEDLKKSNNRVEYIKTLLSEILERIDYRYKGLPRKSDGRILNGPFYKRDFEIFYELDFRGNPPNWETASINTAIKYLESKHDIEVRQYLKRRLVELENEGDVVQNIIEVDEPGKYTLKQRYLILDKLGFLKTEPFSKYSQGKKHIVLSHILKCNERTAEELINQSPRYKVTAKDIQKVNDLLSR